MSDKKTVLIVDDEYSFCKSLKTFLEKIGYEVLVTTNGEQALDLIKSERPAVMTLDIRMPGMDGYEVLQKAKRLNDTMPIVVITAIDVPRMEEMLERSGAHAILQKPIDLRELQATIQRLLTSGAA